MGELLSVTLFARVIANWKIPQERRNPKRFVGFSSQSCLRSSCHLGHEEVQLRDMFAD
jgi:hypothetical protein